MNNITKSIVLWVVVLLVLLSVFNTMVQQTGAAQEVAYTDFYKKLKSGAIESVEIDDLTGVHQIIVAKLADGSYIKTNAPNDDKLLDDLIKKNVTAKFLPPHEKSIWLSLVESILPILLLVGLWFFIMRQMQGGGGKGGAMGFGKSKAKLLSEDQNKVTFADVAGCEEAKEEVAELVDFLRDPSKFQ
ncbi:MAG TPA: hypothetical protein ENJ44_00640, partial [Oceanospirillales bacterium]|nr:hypothetical protein [Oceanospirillales bacterium]